jgi:ribosome biogenesis protein UTP30
VTALKRYTGSSEHTATDLLDEDEFFYIMLSLKKTSPAQRTDKPIRIPLPHPLYDFEGAEICLFVKDDKSGAGHKDAKKRLAQYEKKRISKVVGTSKLRTKFESYEQKRILCGQYDLFLADDRILPSLPKLIGKQFFRKKKQPIPIKLSGKDWSLQFDKARRCTVLTRVAAPAFHQGRTPLPDRTRHQHPAVLNAQTHPKKWPRVLKIPSPARVSMLRSRP